MTARIEPGRLSRSQMLGVLKGELAFRLDPAALPRIIAAADLVARAAGGGPPVYGVNTGFGKLAQTRIAPADTARLQRNLILSHCCGVGEPTPASIVRLTMLLKIASLGRGASGVRPQTIAQLEAMLAAGIVPHVPQQGSVGASGDLAPLAHMTAAMIGEGTVTLAGKTLPAAAALAQCGLQPIELGPKEGLALINGTQFCTAWALAGLLGAQRLWMTALVTGAMAIDADMASTTPFRAEIQALRGHPLQSRSAAILLQLLQGSVIRESHLKGDERVQDPYCMRCQPQVMGACGELLQQAETTLLREANAVTDNPLVLPETGEIVSGGNFHGEPVAFAADQIALALSEIGAIAERRIATLVDPALNFGLPPFLTPRPGLNSGFMIAEVTAAALFAENKQRAMPCSIDSTPTSANQEDHVSMAAHGARRLADMNGNLARILGIELLVAAQGIELRAPLTTSPRLAATIACLRRRVAHLEDDRYMADDLEAAAQLVDSGAIAEAAALGLWFDSE